MSSLEPNMLYSGSEFSAFIERHKTKRFDINVNPFTVIANGMAQKRYITLCRLYGATTVAYFTNDPIYSGLIVRLPTTINGLNMAIFMPTDTHPKIILDATGGVTICDNYNLFMTTVIRANLGITWNM